MLQFGQAVQSRGGIKNRGIVRCRLRSHVNTSSLGSTSVGLDQPSRYCISIEGGLNWLAPKLCHFESVRGYIQILEPWSTTPHPLGEDFYLRTKHHRPELNSDSTWKHSQVGAQLLNKPTVRGLTLVTFPLL